MADLGSLLGAAGIGGAIGQAVVRLELDTAKYQAELKTAQASTVAGTNTMGAATSKFSGLAQTALLGVGVAAVAGAAMSIKAAVEANEAHIKLQNTFENNASLSDSSVEAFEAQAEALRALTGVDDEAIITGQALLAQFDLTGKQVLEITPAVVDLAAKMDIDLQAAFKAVGKATAGSSGILSRYGIVLDQDALAADAFGTTLEGLGVAQGFAAERAEAEPWRVLGSSFEEIAEQVGQALLPAVQTLAEALLKLLPIIELVAQAIQYLPLVQMSEGFETDANAAEKFGNALLDSIPILGHYTDITKDLDDELGAVVAGMVTHTGLIEGLSAAFREQLTPAVREASRGVAEFTGMSEKAFKEWSRETKGSFRTAIFQLEDFTAETDVTKTDVVAAFRAMMRESREFARAMEDLPKGKWVNHEFLQFISEQGPDWIIGFSNLNKEKQRAMQEDWEESGRTFNRSIKGSFLDLNQVLDDLDNKTTSHTVKVKYEYVGFDPTKPGMSGSHQQV